MTERVSVGDLQVAKTLYEFIMEKALPGTGVEPDAFWAGFDKIVADLSPVNRALLEKRDRIQEQLDSWCRDHRGKATDMAAYKAFLSEIGYLVPEREPFLISTENVDEEIAKIAGCSREMAGRVMKTLEEDGLISAHGKTIVVFGTR